MPLLHIIASSGYPHNQDTVARAVDYFQQKEWVVRGQACALRQSDRFAGADQERLDELNELVRFAGLPTEAERITQRKPDLVMALRGGYGLSRLLDRIDFQSIAQADLKFIGHSDFTAFNLAYFNATGKASYNGPMVCFDFGAPDISPFMLEHFWRIYETGKDSIHVETPQPYQFEVEGTIWGGNLTMINQLIGTPFLPKIKNGILFLEDINEHPYRIERNLYQLRDAGILDDQAAVISNNSTATVCTKLIMDMILTVWWRTFARDAKHRF